jgi:hypothetical protein
MLRALVQANPQSLQGILQQLGQSNPQILQIINENQEEFLALLQEPVDASALGGMGGMGGGAAPGQGVIQVTQAEKEAIDRVRIYLRIDSFGISRLIFSPFSAFLFKISSAAWDSTETLLLRPSSHVIRMSNWLPIICWKVAASTTMMISAAMTICK